MAYPRYWIKVGVAATITIAAAAALITVTRPPHLIGVPVLTQSVTAMQSISPKAVHWMDVASPPPNAIASNTPLTDLVTQQALPAGTVLTTSDFTTNQNNGLHPAQIQWLVPVSGAASGLPEVGNRVDIWSLAGKTPQIVAYGVRVIGLYTNSGSSLTQTTPTSFATPTNTNASNIGLVGLAVPAHDLQQLLNLNAPYLVVDPNQTAFRLVGTSTPSTTTSSHPSTSSNKPGVTHQAKKKTSTLPAVHTG